MAVRVDGSEPLERCQAACPFCGREGRPPAPVWCMVLGLLQRTVRQGCGCPWGRVGEGQEAMGRGGFVEWSKGAVGRPGRGQGLQCRVGSLLRGWEAGHGEDSHFLSTQLCEGWLLCCHPQRVRWWVPRAGAWGCWLLTILSQRGPREQGELQLCFFLAGGREGAGHHAPSR